MSTAGARSSDEVMEKGATVREAEEGSAAASKYGWWSQLSFGKKALIVLVPTLAILALALGLGLGLGLAHRNASSTSSSNNSPTGSSAGSSTGPTPNTTWDLPLGGNYTLNATYDPWPKAEATFLAIDLFNTLAEGIKRLTDDGHIAACYFSAGSVESYRPDAGDFPSSAVGTDMVGWEGEKWVDVRDNGVRGIMKKRIAMAKSKGCAGVDADNINGYENDTGFNLTQSDAVDFVRFLAQEAHAQGLMYGLKNGGEIVSQVVDVSDWVINEQCVQTDECDQYAPFIQNNKAVFHVEYTDAEDATTVDADTKANLCAAGNQQGFSTIIKHINLDAWILHC